MLPCVNNFSEPITNNQGVHTDLLLRSVNCVKSVTNTIIWRRSTLDLDCDPVGYGPECHITWNSFREIIKSKAL